jgi:hypothetical protein
MEVTLTLDGELIELLRKHGQPAVLVQEALARYLAELEQLRHRRAVMEAILTGEPIRAPTGTPTLYTKR